MSKALRARSGLSTYIDTKGSTDPSENRKKQQAAFKNERREVSVGARVIVDMDGKKSGVVVSTRPYDDMTVCKVKLDDGREINVSAGRVREVGGK